MVLNMMYLPNADPDNARSEVEDVIGIDATDAIPCSAKTGMGIEEILEAVVARIPPPKGNPDAPLRAMIIDSWFDSYVGVVMLVRVIDGQWLKISRALDAIEARWMAHLAGPLCMGQIAVGCALGYLDFRHADRNWRSERPALAAWYATFAQRPSMTATVPG